MKIYSLILTTILTLQVAPFMMASEKGAVGDSYRQKFDDLGSIIDRLFVTGSDKFTKQLNKQLALLKREDASRFQKENAKMLIDGLTYVIAHREVPTSNFKKFVDVLLDLGVDLTSYDQDGNTSLHHAVVFNDPEIVDTLLKKAAGSRQAIVNLVNKQGRTPLHIAVDHKVKVDDNDALQIMIALAQNGADPKIKDVQGMTSRRLAWKTASYFPLVKAFARAGRGAEVPEQVYDEHKL